MGFNSAFKGVNSRANYQSAQKAVLGAVSLWGQGGRRNKPLQRDCRFAGGVGVPITNFIRNICTACPTSGQLDERRLH